MTNDGPGHDDFAPGWTERWATREIQRRLDAGLNFIAIITGPSGSGKSWAALRLAENIDPLFDPKVHLVFTLDALLELLNTEGAIQPGDVVVFDEAGIGIGSREAMSKVNRIFSAIIESVRYRQFVLLFTVPDLEQIDLNARRMAHLILESVGVDRAAGLARFKPKIPIRGRPGEQWSVYPVLTPKGAPTYRLTRLAISAPGIPLREEYESLRAAHIQSIYDQMDDDMKAVRLKTQNDRLREEVRAKKLKRQSGPPGKPGADPAYPADEIARMRETMSVPEIAAKTGYSIDWVYKKLMTARAARLSEARKPADDPGTH